MREQRVYKIVDTSDRLPTSNGRYGVIVTNYIFSNDIFANNKFIAKEGVTHWLDEVSVYAFTREELEVLLGKVFNDARTDLTTNDKDYITNLLK